MDSILWNQYVHGGGEYLAAHDHSSLRVSCVFCLCTDLLNYGLAQQICLALCGMSIVYSYLPYMADLVLHVVFAPCSMVGAC